MKEGLERRQSDPDNTKDEHDVMVSIENAAADGHPKCLQALLNAGADVNYTNKKNGYTPLIWAARFGQHECTDMLIKAGADVNYTNKKIFYSVLMYASDYEGNARCVKLLTEAGADVNHKNHRFASGTALLTAARHGNTEIVKQLIKAGADMNATGKGPFRPSVSGSGSVIASVIAGDGLH